MAKDISIYRALNRLKENSDFQAVELYLTVKLKNQDVRNRALTNPILMHQGQGRAQELNEFLDMILVSSEKVRKSVI